jgi:hypothetical protein
MCILPNFAKSDLAPKPDRKEKVKKADVEAVEFIVPSKALLENSR